MPKNVPILMKNINWQIQESKTNKQNNPSRMNTKKTTFGHIIKWLKTSDKREKTT